MKTHMLAKAAAWTAAGLLAAGTVTGITYAADSGGTSTDQPSVSTTPSGAGGLFAGRPGGRLGNRSGGLRGRLLRRLEHGSLVVDGKSGERTLLLQRGTLTTVSPTSIRVTSPDGYAATYAVNATTKVRTRDGVGGISSAHEGDHVLVVAVDGAALRILDAGDQPLSSTAGT